MNLIEILLIICAALLAALSVYLYLRLKKAENSEQDSVLTDPQTGLASRAGFEKYFSEMREKNYKAVYYLAYISFDIKKYTQTFGEDRANEVLLNAADVLKKETGDTFVCRYAGGAFIAVHVCASNKNAEDWIKPILTAMNEPIYGDGLEMITLFRAGLLRLKQTDWDMETACSLAEANYAKAVETRQVCCIPNTEDVKKNIVDKMLEGKLDKAVHEGEIEVFLQPIVGAGNSGIVGFEALSRWNSPELGLMGPGRYIDLLAENGKLRAHDLNILEKAADLLQKCKKAGTPYWISINFTRETVSTEGLADEIERIIKKYDFDYKSLTIEVTEDSLIKRKDIARKNLEYLHRLGMNISLDDLGSGYTLFSDLIDFPFNVAKMDRCLVVGTNTEKGRKLLKGYIDVCHELDIQVVCEGIETSEQMKTVCELKTDYIQGFYCYRPMSIAEAGWILENGFVKRGIETWVEKKA